MMMENENKRNSPHNLIGFFLSWKILFTQKNNISYNFINSYCVNGVFCKSNGKRLETNYNNNAKIRRKKSNLRVDNITKRTNLLKHLLQSKRVWPSEVVLFLYNNTIKSYAIIIIKDFLILFNLKIILDKN